MEAFEYPGNPSIDEALIVSSIGLTKRALTSQMAETWHIK